MIDALGRPQSALLLGGTSEIGLAIVTRLVAEGCGTVVLAGRHPEQMAAPAAALRAAGANTVETVPFDAEAVDGHAAFVAETFDRFGDLDVVVAAAGMLGNQTTDEHDPVAAARVLTTNFTGMAAVSLAVADRLRRQGYGRLVVLSSVAGERARRANFVYGSSKAGLDAFAQGLDDSLAGSGVRVTIVRPGFVVGRMTSGMDPAPFATTPEDVATAVVRGIQRGAAVVYAPPVLRWVFAVMRHLPRAVWRRIPG
jgi:decaprenylphospho-beta-D-erythro-pentofuranosid-2-ulose 2-reductase